MICQNAIGYHNEIQELLKKSMLNMNDAQIPLFAQPFLFFLNADLIS